jgi:ATP-dependent Lon protease
MTEKLAMSTLVALCSIAVGRPVQSSMVILGEMSISGTLIKVDELANTLQVCLDSGAKKVLMPATCMPELATVPTDLSTGFDFILYKSAEEAVMKALGAN